MTARTRTTYQIRCALLWSVHELIARRIIRWTVVSAAPLNENTTKGGDEDLRDIRVQHAHDGVLVQADRDVELARRELAPVLGRVRRHAERADTGEPLPPAISCGGRPSLRRRFGAAVLVRSPQRRRHRRQRRRCRREMHRTVVTSCQCHARPAPLPIRRAGAYADVRHEPAPSGPESELATAAEQTHRRWAQQRLRWRSAAPGFYGWL